MKALSESEIALVAGGDAETRSWGEQAGKAVKQLKENPEAALLGPVLGVIYLALK